MVLFDFKSVIVVIQVHIIPLLDISKLHNNLL